MHWKAPKWGPALETHGVREQPWPQGTTSRDRGRVGVLDIWDTIESPLHGRFSLRSSLCPRGS